MSKTIVEKEFDKWLFADKEYQEKHNPFIEAFEKMQENTPRVKLPELNNK